MKPFIIIIIFTSFFYQNLYAQVDWDQETKEQYTILSDNYRAQQYREAEKALEWLKKNPTDFPRKFYLMGEKTYQELEQQSKSRSQKKYYRKAI